MVRHRRFIQATLLSVHQRDVVERRPLAAAIPDHPAQSERLLIQPQRLLIRASLDRDQRQVVQRVPLPSTVVKGSAQPEGLMKQAERAVVLGASDVVTRHVMEDVRLEPVVLEFFGGPERGLICLERWRHAALVHVDARQVLERPGRVAPLPGPLEDRHGLRQVCRGALHLTAHPQDLPERVVGSPAQGVRGLRLEQRVELPLRLLIDALDQHHALDALERHLHPNVRVLGQRLDAPVRAIGVGVGVARRGEASGLPVRLDRLGAVARGVPVIRELRDRSVLPVLELARVRVCGAQVKRLATLR